MRIIHMQNRNIADSDIKIVRQFTKVLFPFCYERENPGQNGMLSEFLTEKGKPLRIWEETEITGTELRSGVHCMLGKQDCSASIAECYRLNPNARRAVGLPVRQETGLKLSTRSGGEFPVRITEVYIYLFESGTGILDIEYEYGLENIKGCINATYFLAETKNEKNTLTHSFRTGASKEALKEETLSFSILGLVKKLLAYAGNAEDFDNENGLRFSSNKPMIYSYILLDGMPENLGELMFNLRNNFREAYKMPPKEYSLNIPAVLQSFSNSYWGFSANGAVNLSFLTGDKVTDAFFSTQFAEKLKSTYFFLYLNTVHQKYAMHRFFKDMGGLDEIVTDYGLMNDKLALAKFYQKKAAAFKFRSFFGVPTSVDHINRFYYAAADSLEIPKLVKNFDGDIENLVSLSQSYINDITRRSELKAGKRKSVVGIFISLATAIVGYFTLLNQSWELIEKITNRQLNMFSPAVLILAFTLLIPVITVIASVWQTITDIKKQNYEYSKYNYINHLTGDSGKNANLKK